jgi:hypothetical protein
MYKLQSLDLVGAVVEHFLPREPTARRSQQERNAIDNELELTLQDRYLQDCRKKRACFHHQWDLALHQQSIQWLRVQD